MVERHPYKVDVAGSNPVLPTKSYNLQISDVQIVKITPRSGGRQLLLLSMMNLINVMYGGENLHWNRFFLSQRPAAITLFILPVNRGLGGA